MKVGSLVRHQRRDKWEIGLIVDAWIDDGVYEDPPEPGITILWCADNMRQHWWEDEWYLLEVISESR